MSKALDTVASIAVPAVGYAVGGPAGGAIASGLYTGVKTGNPLAGLAAGAGSYAGSSLGSSLFGGSTFGSVLGDSAANAVGPSFIDPGLSGILGESTSNALGAQLANTSIGSALGGWYGGNVATDLAMPQQEAKASAPAGPAPFVPSREGEMVRPASLSGFGSLAPDQISSNIATQGVYGGGQGPSEQDYFLNLINRRLVDDTGAVDQDLSEVSPIESSYLQQLGLGGYNNANSLLEAIAGYQA